jgi:hypothetical protein
MRGLARYAVWFVVLLIITALIVLLFYKAALRLIKSYVERLML